MNVENNSPGRPSKRKQWEIYQSILECFRDGLESKSAAKKASVNLKTVRKYYKEISKKYKEKTFSDLFERQEAERIQIIAMLDQDIEDARELLTQIRKQKQQYLDQGKPVPAYLFDQELKALKHLSTVKDRKAGYVTKPTPREEYLREMKDDDSEEAKDDKAR